MANHIHDVALVSSTEGVAERLVSAVIGNGREGSGPQILDRLTDILVRPVMPESLKAGPQVFEIHPEDRY